MKQLAGLTGAGLGLLFAFVVVNGVFIGTQKLWHRNKAKRLDEIKRTLVSERVAIREAEPELRRLAENIQTSDADLVLLKTRIDSCKSIFGITLRDRQPGLIDQYNAIVESQHSQHARYAQLVAPYSKRVAKYNTLVEEANKLNREIGTTRYIIPLPRGIGRLRLGRRR